MKTTILEDLKKSREAILKDFKKLREDGLIKEDFTNYKELLDVLSEIFAHQYEEYSDAQDAFDDLNDYLDGKLNQHRGVYTLGTEEWRIKIDVKEPEKLNDLMEQWGKCYGSVSDADDLASSIEHRVMKDMSNAGCDVYNALDMICSEVFDEVDNIDSFIYVDMGEPSPRIDFLI